MKRALFIVGAVLLAIFSVYFFQRNQQFVNNNDKANGAIIGSERLNRTKGPDTFCPIVEFQAEDGNRYTFQGEPCLHPQYKIEIGEAVKVAYDKDQPQSAKILSFWSLWGVSLILAALAVGCFIFSIFTGD